jgi:hypothetical protein
VEHERIGVAAELGDNERDALSHEAGDERHVTAQAIQLRDDDRGLVAAGLGERGGELRAAIERVGTLARLNLDMFGDDLEALGLGEARDGLALTLKAEPATLGGGPLEGCPAWQPNCQLEALQLAMRSANLLTMRYEPLCKGRRSMIDVTMVKAIRGVTFGSVPD